jgi:hypothetical protein
MEYYSGIRKNEIMESAGKWVKLEIMLSKSGSEVQRSRVLSHMWNLDLKKYRYIPIYLQKLACN